MLKKTVGGVRPYSVTMITEELDMKLSFYNSTQPQHNPHTVWTRKIKPKHNKNTWTSTPKHSKENTKLKIFWERH